MWSGSFDFMLRKYLRIRRQEFSLSLVSWVYGGRYIFVEMYTYSEIFRVSEVWYIVKYNLEEKFVF